MNRCFSLWRCWCYCWSAAASTTSRAGSPTSTACFPPISTRSTARNRPKRWRLRGNSEPLHEGDTPEAYAKQADAAMAYARHFPTSSDIDADPLGHRLTIRFASGWRVAVNPVKDGKSGAETPGIATTPPR